MIMDLEHIGNKCGFSDTGMLNIMTPEGTHKTLGNTVEWRPGDAWGQHDFTQASAEQPTEQRK